MESMLDKLHLHITYKINQIGGLLQNESILLQGKFSYIL